MKDVKSALYSPNLARDDEACREVLLRSSMLMAWRCNNAPYLCKRSLGGAPKSFASSTLLDHAQPPLGPMYEKLLFRTSRRIRPSALL